MEMHFKILSCEADVAIGQFQMQKRCFMGSSAWLLWYFKCNWPPQLIGVALLGDVALQE